SYDSGETRTVGFISQYITNDSLIVENADNFVLKGTADNQGDPCNGSNPCFVSSVTFGVFNYIVQPTNLSGTPDDYLGLVAAISEDKDDGDPLTLDSAPACNLIDPPPAFPASTYHVSAPGFPNGCAHEIVLGPHANMNPSVSGNYWQWQEDPFIACDPFPCLEITVHFDPPLKLTKNNKYWLSVFFVLPNEDAGGYRVVWRNANEFDGIYPRQWVTGGAMQWNNVTLVPPGDFLFQINGASIAAGCGNCQREGDVFPAGPVMGSGNCHIDLDDLLYLLAAMADPITFPGADISGCTNDFPCTVNQDCCDLHGFCDQGGVYNVDCQFVIVGPAGNPASFQRRCALVDIDDLGTLLNAFAGNPTICGDPCSPGACKNIPPIPCSVPEDPECPDCPTGVPCVDGFCDFGADGPPNCHDASNYPFTMSEEDCFILGGTYCGDYSMCGDPGCP
ncbi:MAG: hypothetical protein AABZ47_09025, partial [Planctomycetota bacterium]